MVTNLKIGIQFLLIKSCLLTIKFPIKFEDIFCFKRQFCVQPGSCCFKRMIFGGLLLLRVCNVSLETGNIVKYKNVL